MIGAEVLTIEGLAKAGVLHDVLEGPKDPERLPIQLIQPLTGKLTWIADAEAATRVTVR